MHPVRPIGPAGRVRHTWRRLAVALGAAPALSLRLTPPGAPPAQAEDDHSGEDAPGAVDLQRQDASDLAGVGTQAAAGNSAGTAPEYPAAKGAGGLLAVAASTPGDALSPFEHPRPLGAPGRPGRGDPLRCPRRGVRLLERRLDGHGPHLRPGGPRARDVPRLEARPGGASGGGHGRPDFRPVPRSVAHLS